MQAIQNLGLAVVPLVAGYIVDHNGYLMLEVFFCAMLCIALIAGTCTCAVCAAVIRVCTCGTSGILLYILDSSGGGALNKSAWVRKREEKEKEEEEEAAAKKAEELMKGKPDDGYTSNISPSTAFQIRNRYLSRMGAKVRFP